VFHFLITARLCTRLFSSRLQSEREESRHVPIVATLAVLALYIAMGALLFAQWENWNVLDGAYFCFITFTTIGFGDLVPGKGTVTESKAGKAAMCALFLLFGMIVMAMSFKLMQDEIISKFRRFGRRFGFITRNMNDSG
jgi:cytochrome b561